MKNLLLVFFLFLTSLSFAQDTIVDAQFPGGKPAMMKFLMNNFRYPESAIENGRQGKCWLKLTIEADGSISNIQVTKSIPNCPECDAEAIRVVSMMPKWLPAKKNDIAVPSFYDLPVNFALSR